MRILIVRLSALGDTALTVPLLLALREALPEAHLGWVVEELSAPLLETLPQLDTLHVWRKKDRNALGMWRLGRELRAHRYQVSIDAQGLTKSALLPWLAGIPRRVGFARAPLEARELSPILNNIRISPPPQVRHIADRILCLGQGMGLDLLSLPRPSFPVDPAAHRRMLDWWNRDGLGNKVVVFGISSSWVTKMWPVEHMASIVNLARDRGYRCVLTWGPGDAQKLPRWIEVLGEAVVPSPPTTHLADLVALLSLGERYAGPDSASLHLAWLLGKPTFSWFGPSDSERAGPCGSGQVRVTAHPPTRKKEGPMLHCLHPDRVVPLFQAWLDNEYENNNNRGDDSTQGNCC